MRSYLGLLLGLSVWACVGDSSPTGDAGTDAKNDVTLTEASVDAGPKCDRSKPFGTAVHFPAPFNSTGPEDSIWLSSDELTAYVSTIRNPDAAAGDLDIFVATRGQIGDAFGNLSPLQNINTTSQELQGTVSSDGLNIYFTTTRDAIYDLYVATRSVSTADFGTPTPVANLNTANTTISPYLSLGDTQLYFAAGTSPYDLFVAQRGGSSGPFGAAVPIGAINTSADESSPVVSGDGLTLFFTSDRAGSTFGTENIWVATRGDTSSGWGTAQAVDELNSDDFDIPSWASPDGCRLYFTSNRTDSLGDYDIYYADRPAP